MSGLNPQDFELLNGGGTLVVPTAQRAAAVRLAYDRMQVRTGERVWATPRVLPWSAWLEHGLDEARSLGREVPRRLSRVETWWLWRGALHAACTEDLAVLWPDGLIDAVRRATLLLEDHGIELREPITPEMTVLRRAQTHFSAACGQRGAIWSASWRACSPYLQLTSPTRLAGFEELGPARARWLRERGVLGPEGRRSVRETGRDLRVRILRDPEEEARAAADWCAQQLEADGAARLLVVAPRLRESRHRWLRAFAQRFGTARLIEPADLQEEVATGGMQAADAFAIEGGEPLAGYALVDVALQLLSLAAGEHEFTMLSAVLRSPYLSDAERSERLRIDAWLRQQNVDPGQAQLPSLFEIMGRVLGESAARLLQGLLQPLERLPDDGFAATRAPPAVWARRFAQRLQRAGWPGAPLDSAEQQQRVRFEELLGEVATLADPVSLSAASACTLLRQLTQRTAFEPATDDAPVTLTSELGDPVARYDGIWVAGLTADTWPEVLRPDPMIPFGLQRAAAMPGADPGAALERATRALQDWRQATPCLVLSYPESEGDVANDPSPLLQELVATGAASQHGRAASAPFDLGAWLSQSAPTLERFLDDRGPAWPDGRALRGGARLLELQALCPFRAFAELRLEAGTLSEPVPGIAPMVRGQVLHRALELFWSEIGNSVNLHARREELPELARLHIERALQEAHVQVPGGLDSRLMRHEAQRNAELFKRLVEWELARGEFEVAALEKAEIHGNGHAGLQLRLDRIDRLRGGELIIFDYKTGNAEPFKPHEERLRRPQLPAYAVATGPRTAAVAALYLTRAGIKARGVSDRGDRLAGMRLLKADQPDWAGLLERWRTGLGALLVEFLAGEARVSPLPGACDFCHLRAACRVQLAPVTEPAEEPAEENSEGETP